MTTADGLTFMKRLKRETHAQHVDLVRLPFITSLIDGSLPLAAYVNQLRAFATVFGALEDVVAAGNGSSLRASLGLEGSRFSRLLQDIGCFGMEMIPEIPQVRRTAVAMASRIRLLSLERPGALPGYIYVLQGTILGNRVHLPDVKRNYGLTGTQGASFYAGYGHGADEYWEGFTALLNGAVEGGADAGDIIAAAREAFEFLHDIHSALYPLPTAEEMNFSATGINPEAGNHAVPDDRMEIRAALMAADACRVAYPYFDVRYGERGKRFAQSDAAWLASLVEMPESEVVAQVAWLGGVLSSRGMPRITMEYQLTALYEALVAAHPDRQPEYERLLGAREWLRGERVRRIPEELFDEVVAAFVTASGGELDGALQGMGRIIVSAVCDEAGGIFGAVATVRQWATDGVRFSAGWITAVRETIAHAEKTLAF